MRRSLANLVALAAGAVLVFALGVLAARCEPGPPTASGDVVIVIDAGAIDLLPDASLRLDPLPAWDAAPAPE